MPVGPRSYSRLLFPGLASDTAKPLASEKAGQASLKAMRNLTAGTLFTAAFPDPDVKEELAEASSQYGERQNLPPEL